MVQPVVGGVLNAMDQESQSTFDCWQLDVRRVDETFMCIMYFEFGTRGWKFKVDVPAGALPTHPVDVPKRCTFKRVRSIGRDMLTDVQLEPGGEFYPVAPYN